jgi:uncharacterized low-complexity protein
MSQALRKPVVAAIGAAFTGSMLITGGASAANPFALSELNGGYAQIVSSQSEGKCGAGKCGGSAAMPEGKCGGSAMMPEGKCGAGKCGGSAMVPEGKCGAGKCGAGKCGGSVKMPEGKCGAGKCGGAN